MRTSWFNFVKKGLSNVISGVANMVRSRVFGRLGIPSATIEVSPLFLNRPSE